MLAEIKVPVVGESITEVTLVKWIKKTGEWAERDEVIAELESEKATFEINAEQAGIITTLATEGDTIKIGDVVCKIDTDAAKPEGTATPKAAEVKNAAKEKNAETKEPSKTAAPDVNATPVAAAMIADKKVDPKSITPTGSNGKIFKQDVLDALNNPGRKPGWHPDANRPTVGGSPRPRRSPRSQPPHPPRRRAALGRRVSFEARPSRKFGPQRTHGGTAITPREHLPTRVRRLPESARHQPLRTGPDHRSRWRHANRGDRCNG